MVCSRLSDTKSGRFGQLQLSFLVAMSKSFSSDDEPARLGSRQPLKPTKGGWIRWLPGWITLRHYRSSWLRYDLVAGLVMTTMLVPVGIAYAEASGLPGICLE